MESYEVIILQDGETAILKCNSLSEAIAVYQSFLNYGKCQSVFIKKQT